MRARVVVAPILALAAVLLARRRRRATHAAVPLGAPPTAESAPVAPLAPPPHPAAAPVAPPAPPSPFASVPWELVAAPDDRPHLTVRYAAGAHMQLDRVDAQETPTQVFVTVLLRWRAPASETPASDTAAEPFAHEATVSLSAPLGGRELVHAPTDVAPPSATGDDPSGPPLYP